MTRMLHNLRVAIITCITFWLMSVSFVLAQDTDGFDALAFETLATRATDVVDASGASNDALENLRQQLSNFRSQALEEQELRGRAARSLREQVAALGAPPADGETEAQEVAQRRADLNEELANASAPVQVANSAYERADGLISQIDGIIRKRQADALLQRDASPLNPSNWPMAGSALFGFLGSISTEVSSELENEATAVDRARNAPVIIILTLLGLALLIPGTALVLRHLSRSHKPNRSALYDLRQIILSFAILALPLLGLYLIVQAIGLANILGLRGELIRQAYFPIGAAIMGGYWIASTFFATNGPDLKPITFDQGRLGSGAKSVRLLGWVLAIFYLLEAFKKGADWSAATTSVLTFPVVLVGAFALFHLARQFQKFKLAKAKQLNENAGAGGSYDRLTRLIVLFTYGVAILAPLVAVVGYTNASKQMIMSTILSIGLAGALIITYTFFVALLQLFEPEKQVAFVDGQEQVKQTGGIWRVLLAALTIFASLPILALIWGARNSDLQDVWRYMKEGVALGETRISASDFLTFILIFFIGYTITRLLQSAMRNTVLPNTKINSGAQNALVTGLGYIGIFISALFAILATGLDLSNIAIVAGALSVGIGFGLQAIVSNFVSGIILLIERPIELGDWVEVGSHSGYVRDISVRSTSIETFDRATVIVPNADLIAGTVTNWTHGDNYGRVKVPVGVAYGTDTRQVEEILIDIAKSHPMVLGHPAPFVMFQGFGASSMDFEIRAILRDVNWVGSVRSDMNHTIVERFAEAGIEIPFDQREVTIKNPQALAAPKPKSRAKKQS